MKKFLKIFFSAFVIFVLYGAWGIILTNREEAGLFVKNSIQEKLGINLPCRKPLEFSIGRIDPQFQITSQRLAVLSREAAAVWNAASQKNVLEYSAEADFKINLIFDERQASTLIAKDLENDLESLEATHKDLIDKYNTLDVNYQKKIEQYEKEVEDYEKKAQEYNDQIEYWNKKGDISQEEYEELKDMREELEDEFSALEKKRQEINRLAKQENQLADREEKMVNSYNAKVNTYESLFGRTREFEKGIFEGEAINIYQFEKEADLKLTLIHELGHYLGLEHVENPESIMYYLIGKQDLDRPRFSEEDIRELSAVCKLNLSVNGNQ